MRKRGRPKLPESEKRVSIAFRFTGEEWEWLHEQAAAENRPIMALLREMMADYKKKVARKNAVAA